MIDLILPVAVLVAALTVLAGLLFILASWLGRWSVWLTGYLLAVAAVAAALIGTGGAG